jgi:hypothetical protein
MLTLHQASMAAELGFRIGEAWGLRNASEGAVTEDVVMAHYQITRRLPHPLRSSQTVLQSLTARASKSEYCDRE